MDKPGRILVIDDDADIVTYLGTILKDHGYEVLTATDGAAGLETARRDRPDLICLDIAMPPPTGVRVYRDLRDDPELKGIPVVMVTGVMPQFKEFIHHRKKVPPPDGYIQKPFDPADVIATVGRLLTPVAHA
jgi:CheY-like chemotaxis protein